MSAAPKQLCLARGASAFNMLPKSDVRSSHIVCLMSQKNTNGRTAATPAFEHSVTTVPEALNFEQHDDASASLNLLLSASAIPSSHSSFSSSTAPPQSRDFSLSTSPDTGMADSFSPPSSMHSHMSTPFPHPNWTNEADPIYNEHIGQFAAATQASSVNRSLDDHSARATADCEPLPNVACTRLTADASFQSCESWSIGYAARHPLVLAEVCSPRCKWHRVVLPCPGSS